MKKTVLIWLLPLIFCACQQDDAGLAPKVDIPFRLLADSTAQQKGAALFAKHCRECHGTAAEGRNPRAAEFIPPAPDFLDTAYAKKDPAYLFWRISEGKMSEPFFSRGSVMPSFKPYFSKQQIWQLVAYIRSRASGSSGE